MNLNKRQLMIRNQEARALRLMRAGYFSCTVVDFGPELSCIWIY